MPIVEKTLMDYSDLELKKALHDRSNWVDFNYNDIRLEIERRATEKHNGRVFNLSIVAIAVSVISLLGSVLVALFK
jgi:hypothetical protein